MFVYLAVLHKHFNSLWYQSNCAVSTRYTASHTVLTTRSLPFCRETVVVSHWCSILFVIPVSTCSLRAHLQVRESVIWRDQNIKAIGESMHAASKQQSKQQAALQVQRVSHRSCTCSCLDCSLLVACMPRCWIVGAACLHAACQPCCIEII